MKKPKLSFEDYLQLAFEVVESGLDEDPQKMINFHFRLYDQVRATLPEDPENNPQRICVDPPEGIEAPSFIVGRSGDNCLFISRVSHELTEQARALATEDAEHTILEQVLELKQPFLLLMDFRPEPDSGAEFFMQIYTVK